MIEAYQVLTKTSLTLSSCRLLLLDLTSASLSIDFTHNASLQSELLLMKHQMLSLKRCLDKLNDVSCSSKKRKRSYTVNSEYTLTEHFEREQKWKVFLINQQSHTKRVCQSLLEHIFKCNNKDSIIELEINFNDRENIAVNAQATQSQQLISEALQKTQDQYQRKFVHSKSFEIC